VASQLFSPGILVFSTNKIVGHNKTEILFVSGLEHPYTLPMYQVHLDLGTNKCCIKYTLIWAPINVVNINNAFL
jgi:hypothetical protein